jgi:hypothetical protein
VSTYDLGDAVLLSTTVYDPSTGLPADATMALSVTKPDGSAGSIGSISHPSTGNYNASTTATDQVGVWFYKWTASGALIAVDSGQFTVANPAPPAYASLAQLKKRLRITDTTDDDELIKKLLTASRRIDRDTGRRFWCDAAPSARIYDIQHERKIIVDDMSTTTGVTVEIGINPSFTLMDSTVYRFTPENAIARRRVPFIIEANSWFRWLFGRQIRVTAVWGWPQVPDEITEACLLLAQRLFRRKDSPEGVMGFNDLGVVRLGRYDPDYDALVAPYERKEI